MIFAKPTWIEFYLWMHEGQPIYVGQSVDVGNRNKNRQRERSVIGRFLAKHANNCVLESLDIKVWDVPQGRWANRIENALMDLYGTLHPKGYNMCYATDKGYLDAARMGGLAQPREAKSRAGRLGARQAHERHPNLAEENGERFAAFGYLGPLAQPHEAKVKGGKIIGRMNVESGHFQRLKTKEHQSRAGHIGGLNSSGPHVRWHILHKIVNPKCRFCKGGIS